jgi:hypothetical protein
LFDPGKKAFPVGIAHRNALVSNKYYIPFDGFNLINGYKVGFMHPAKFIWWQAFFKFAEALQGHYLFVLTYDPEIIFHTFNIEDLIKINTFKAILSLYKDKSITY